MVFKKCNPGANNGCDCGNCRCDEVDCYTNLSSDGTGCVNETEFILTNIPSSIVLWGYEFANPGLGRPELFVRYTVKTATPYTSDASALNGTYNYERGSDPISADTFCRFPFWAIGFFPTRNAISVVADVDRFFASPTGTTNLVAFGSTLTDVAVTLSINILNDEKSNIAPFLPGPSTNNLAVNAADWYMHYIAVDIGNQQSNPICPIVSSQATCGISDLSWITEPFVNSPYPTSQSLDWSAYRNTYATGSTAESFP